MQADWVVLLVGRRDRLPGFQNGRRLLASDWLVGEPAEDETKDETFWGMY